MPGFKPSLPRLTPKAEAAFTAAVQNNIEPALISMLTTATVIDAENKIIATCPTKEMAAIVHRLLWFALENYPFHHPGPPTLVRRGLFAEGKNADNQATATLRRQLQGLKAQLQNVIAQIPDTHGDT